MTKKLLLATILFLEVILSNHLLSQNYCIPNRFTDANYFKSCDIQTDTNVVYGKALNYKGQEILLSLDLYYPKLSADKLKKRPFIMLIHGSGEEGGVTREQKRNLCVLLAARGFVATTIDYRLYGKRKPFQGDNSNKIIDGDIYSQIDVGTDMRIAIYRSVQDLNCALNYCKDNYTKYGIDTNMIIIGGSSQGAVISMAYAYNTQKEYDKLDSTLHIQLGKIEETTPGFKKNIQIKGVLDMWGAIADTTMITATDASQIALIIFHGTADTNMTYDIRVGAPENYKMRSYGSLSIASRYRNLGGCYQLHTKLKGGHGEEFNKDILAEKIGSFYKNVFCNKCKSEEFVTSLKTKTDTFIVKIGAVLLVILFIILTMKFTKRRRRKLNN